MKRITLVYGSPRKDGNSDKLGGAFARGAKASGNDVVEFFIRDMQINGCIGCEICYENMGECVQNDDMQKVLRRLYQSDILVFVTPIYYQGFTSQLKAVVDRLYVSENKPFSINGAYLLATYASSGEEMSTLTRDYFRALINYHQWNNLGEIFVSEMDERTDIIDNSSLEHAYSLGKNV